MSELSPTYTVSQPTIYAGIALHPAGILIALLTDEPTLPVDLAEIPVGALVGPASVRFKGYVAIAGTLVNHLRNNGSPASIAITAPDPVSSGYRHVALIELGAVVRQQLLAVGWSLIEVGPSTLHRFLYPADPIRSSHRGFSKRPPAPNSHSSAAALTPPPDAAALALAHIARCGLQPDLYGTLQATVVARLLAAHSPPPRANV